MMPALKSKVTRAMKSTTRLPGTWLVRVSPKARVVVIATPTAIPTRGHADADLQRVAENAPRRSS